jgi:redox-sensitive bicupin YhaK (pirin superfamily)
MQTLYHKANTRGHVDYGWLNSYHTFSFGNYQNPERMNFGLLRVLNDDVVAPGMGFGKHPHDNMEIISIPLRGDLKHGDNIGNSEVIREGDIQVMSAGTGVVHSEFNPNSSKDVNFLQIWIFPGIQGVKPRYDQLSLREIEKPNIFYQILSPHKNDQGVWIHQNAWMHMGEFDALKKAGYKLKQNGNGVYIFVLKGEVIVGEQKLQSRDGCGIWDISEFELFASASSKVLVIEVPMK